MPPLTIILVEKTGELKTLSIKDYKEDELFKKCGFKKADDFSKHIDWSAKIDGQKYIISMYGKSEGKANMENKYDFPPPVDNKLYFGCCALVAQISDDLNKKSLSNLSLDLWNKIYDKLFGSREEVWNCKSYKTTGGLIKNDLIMNSSGKIVSKKKCIQEKTNNRFKKYEI